MLCLARRGQAYISIAHSIERLQLTTCSAGYDEKLFAHNRILSDLSRCTNFQIVIHQYINCQWQGPSDRTKFEIYQQCQWKYCIQTMHGQNGVKLTYEALRRFPILIALRNFTSLFRYYSLIQCIPANFILSCKVFEATKNKGKLSANTVKIVRKRKNLSK